MGGGNRQPYILIKNATKIRKLTPRECFRLMGFDDKDFDILSENGISNTQLYKMAGNSIVVNVLENIFKELYMSKLQDFENKAGTIFVYDFEVFAYDWIMVLKGINTSYLVFHNDTEHLKEFLHDHDYAILCGFNNKHYDRFILQSILAGADNQMVKEINDFIVSGSNGWDHSYIKENKAPWINQFDLFDDCQQGLSLKSIEAHLGMDIRETTVPFDIDRPLTDEELEEVIYYCKHDVEATVKLLELRLDYLENKINIGASKGIPPAKALYMTNAKLTAAYLDAERQDHDDERNYQYPANLLREYIPQEVFDFFDRLKDTSITDSVVFSSKLNITIDDCQCVIAYGGIHGAIPKYQETATDTRVIRNVDVASYYPHLLTIDGYISRNIPDGKAYEEMLEKRMKAKKAGDKATANALKLVANTTYGGMLNQYNDLYDPLMARSVCITGQLRLLELANHLKADCKTLKIIQLNTDGIMVSLDKTDIETYENICREWQDRTGFELEEDNISKVIQKDVNGYLEIQDKGNVKIKGGVLVRGISQAGAFNINNNATIISTAIIEYFTKGIPVEETINNCNDILAFQLIAKASRKYCGVYHLIGKGYYSVQMCNRVYASADKKYGTLIKVHAERGNDNKMAGLPDHCVIDNNNELSIEAVDKTWYVNQAKKYINDFIGGKKLATKKEEPSMNIYQKLSAARNDFLKAGVTKSGVNLHAEFKYFELEDIVPTATEIFNNYNCLFLTTFIDGKAIGKLINLENTDETITVEFEARSISEPAKFRMNEVQALGAEITYMRRYLYFLILNIIEADTIDSGENTPPSAPPATKKKPVTAEERKEIKEELTAVDAPADALQIKALKAALKKLKDIDSSKESFIQELAVRTNKFKTVTKDQCEKMILTITDMINAYNEE